MKSLATFLRHLGRPGVTELALGTGRPPCVKHEGAYRPLAPEALTSEDILQLLAQTTGGTPPAVSEQPTQWAAQVEGMPVDIVALKRGGALQAKITKGKAQAAAA